MTAAADPTPAGDAALAAVRGPEPHLRTRLAEPTDFLVIVEVVPWRGPLADERGQAVLACARELAADPRVAALSITDNAGGHPMIPPQALAEGFAADGRETIVHVACRDRSRSALQGLGWELQSLGLTNVLAVSGDYPVGGYEGLSRPVFDMDSVGLLSLYRDLGGFYLGAAVNPFKRHERELLPQLLKLELKVRSGADFVISQAGYDARAQDQLLRYLRRRGLPVPVIANAYILSRAVARIFHAGTIPGCVVTDELLELAEHQAASPDRGRAFFLELAAKQVAIARGLGFRGVYLSGHRRATDLERVLELADGFGSNDWRTFVQDLTFAQPGTFRYFEMDPATGLATDRVDRDYLRSRSGRARASARSRSPLDYRTNRLAHDLVFDPAAPGFPVGAAVYSFAERVHLGRPLHAFEQAVKTPLYDCRDCGDCSLPDMAYLCPESHCRKNQRNGPCGGSHDGLCEAAERACIWAQAYDRLKPWGVELRMLERPPVIADNALRRTSAWANTFLGRDHFARRAAATSPHRTDRTDRTGATGPTGKQ